MRTQQAAGRTLRQGVQSRAGARQLFAAWQACEPTQGTEKQVGSARAWRVCRAQAAVCKGVGWWYREGLRWRAASAATKYWASVYEGASEAENRTGVLQEAQDS